MAVNKAHIDLNLHPKQGVAFNTEATEVLYGGAAGGGKLLPLDARLPTPFGWIAMGDVRPGLQLFDETGAICTVTQVHPIEVLPELYRLTFDDQSSIECCADHLWHTFTRADLSAMTRRDDDWRERRRLARPSRATGKRSAAFTAAVTARNKRLPPETMPAPTGAVRSTRDIVATLRTNQGACNHAVAVAGALDLPAADLPIDPYVLGVWLGDGTELSAQLISADPEIWQEIERRGYVVTHHKDDPLSHWIRGLRSDLRSIDMLGRKHIPLAYLRASAAQRLDLLRGLMDTDGTVARSSGLAEFCNTNEAIIDGVYELIVSLGWKVAKREGVARLNGRVIGRKWTLKWMPSECVFLLPRKVALQGIARRRTQKFRYITAAERIPSRPGRCIAVDSPNHLYLAGSQMIPTHNSHLMRAAAITWCGMIPGLQVYLFRRLREDLIKNHMEGPKGLRAMLAPWVQAGFANMVEDEIRFWNGSKIYLCHCKDEKDRFKYLGAEIHVLLMDELTTFTEVIYRFLRSRVRMVGIEVPEGLKGKFPRILCSSNPGNIGHHWVKAAFIDARPPFVIAKVASEDGGMLRQFIPAKLQDNMSMDEDDPGYSQKLEGLGNAALVSAMRDGDWNVIAGAFFPEFDTARHVIVPQSLPMYWHRFRSFDWGSAKPFSVHWWAVSDGELPGFPRNALIGYREWYGAKKDKSGVTIPNQGLRLTAEEVADGIREREESDLNERKQMSGVADPAIFSEDGGPSIASRMAARKVFFRPADNKRVPQHGAMGGWDQLRARLKGDGEHPGIFFFDTCVDLIRTLPALQSDTDRPEDCDSDGEDHCADETRYACMSRPYTAPLPAELIPQRDGYRRRWRPGRPQGSAWSS